MYAFVGDAATYYRTSGGVPIPGSGIGNKNFYRIGFTGQLYLGPHFDLNVVTQHGYDNAWFGQGYGSAIATNGNGVANCTSPTVANGCPPNNTPGTVLPAGSQAPIWNGYTFEARYVASPQLIFIAHYDAERMSQQANGPGYLAGAARSNLGNINLYDFLIRWNPFMTSRAGFALQPEFTVFQQRGTGPIQPATLVGTTLNSSELMLAFDFAF